MEGENNLKEAVESSITTSIGVSKIPLSVLKRFKDFAYLEAEGNYAKSIELLLNFYEHSVLRILSEHEERIAKLESSAPTVVQETKKEGKPLIKRFGGTNE